MSPDLPMRLAFSLWILLGATAIAVLGATAIAAPDTAFFEEKVLPLLRERCYECHSHEKKIKGGLALDSRGATILHQFGMDHEQLAWRQLGRDFRLADVYGNVVKEILA